MLKRAAAAFAMAIVLAIAPAHGQASSGESPASEGPDPGPHPELSPDTDYAFWCHATISTLVMMDVLQEKHFKQDPAKVMQKLDQHIGNVASNLKKEKVEKMLQDYNNYYLSDTVAFSTSKNPKDLRKDIRSCRSYF